MPNPFEVAAVRRVLLIGDASSPHLALAARHLQELGIIVETVSGQPPISGYPHLVHVIPGKLALTFTFRAWHAVRRLLRNTGFDVVNAHYATRYGLVARLASGKTPLVINVWGSDIQSARSQRPYFRYLLRRILSGATVVAATSAALADSANRYVGPKIPVVVTPFGVDLARFSTERNTKETFSVLSIRGYDPNYGYAVLVRAFRHVVDAVPDAKLVLGGRGDRGPIERLVAQLRLERNVDLLPTVPYSDVPSFLASVHVVAVPSLWWEGFGVFAVEAAASARAVVASRVGGLVDIVCDGQTGVMVAPGAESDLADALIHFARNRHVPARMGTAARLRAEEKFDVKRTIVALVSAYELAVERAELLRCGGRQRAFHA